MPQAIGDPDELDRFAQSLTQFIDTLNEAVNGLNHSFGAAGIPGGDEKRASFEEDYNALVQQLLILRRTHRNRSLIFTLWPHVKRLFTELRWGMAYVSVGQVENLEEAIAGLQVGL